MLVAEPRGSQLISRRIDPRAAAPQLAGLGVDQVLYVLLPAGAVTAELPACPGPAAPAVGSSSPVTSAGRAPDAAQEARWRWAPRSRAAGPGPVRR